MSFNGTKHCYDGWNFLRSLLNALAYKLPDDCYLQLVLCGGSVLALYYPQLGYQATTDADVFDYHNAEIPDSLYPYIDQVAMENNVGNDWFNDAIMRHNDPDYVHNLKKAEYIGFIENYDTPEYFYNKNGYPVLAMYHLSLLGLIASKLVAGRQKDFEAMVKIVPFLYASPEDVELDFQRYALSFVNTPHYQVVKQRLRALF